MHPIIIKPTTPYPPWVHPFLMEKCYLNQSSHITVLFFFLSVRKNILKEPQENKRPTKEYRGGHKQRETRENKKQIEQKRTKYNEEN